MCATCSLLILSEPTFGPVATVELAVADGLGDVLGLDVGLSCEVGNGAGNLEDARIGTRRERQTFHGHAQEFKPGLVGFGILVDPNPKMACMA